ncbi:Na+/H+ antiporter NhaA [Streptomyces sp. NPDC001795]|uniref:Na+/H+ antiporter NhaA n=1 Tax=unclassified Streptomyces TaxID=2593676 RepID=UPI00331DD6A6
MSAVKRIARLAWVDIAGIGVLAGIGFTASLLFAELSYDSPDYLTEAKGAVLLASAASSVMAALVLGCRSRHYHRGTQRLEDERGTTWTQD